MILPEFKIINTNTGEEIRAGAIAYIDYVSETIKYVDTEENKKAYDLQQAQRKLERTIRKWKIQKNGYKEAMDKAEDDETREVLDAQYQKAKEKVTYYNKKYGQFCEENDLKLQY